MVESLSLVICLPASGPGPSPMPVLELPAGQYSFGCKKSGGTCCPGKFGDDALVAVIMAEQLAVLK